MPFHGVKTKSKAVSRAIFGGGYKRQKDDAASSSDSAVATAANSSSSTNNSSNPKYYDILPPWQSPEQKTHNNNDSYALDDKRQESSSSSSSAQSPQPVLVFEAYNGDCDTPPTTTTRSGGFAAASRRDAVSVKDDSRVSWSNHTSAHQTSQRMEPNHRQASDDNALLLDHLSSNTNNTTTSRTIMDPFQNINEIGPTSSNIHLLLLDDEDTDHTSGHSHTQQQAVAAHTTDPAEDDALFDELVSARGRDALLVFHNNNNKTVAPSVGIVETREPLPAAVTATSPTTRAVFQEEKQPKPLLPLDAEESRTTTLQSTEPQYLPYDDNNNSQRRQDPPSSRGSLSSPPRDPQGSFFSSVAAPLLLPKDPSGDSVLLIETSSRLLLGSSVGSAASPSRRGTEPAFCRTPPPRSQQQQHASQSPVSSLIQQFETHHSPKQLQHQQQQPHLKITWQNGKEIVPDTTRTGGSHISRSCIPVPTTAKAGSNTTIGSHLKITWQNGKEVLPDTTSSGGGGGSSCTRITTTSHHVRRASTGDGNRNFHSFRRLQRRDSDPVVLEHHHHEQQQQSAGPRDMDQDASPSRHYKMFPRTSPMNNNRSNSTREAVGQHPSFYQEDNVVKASITTPSLSFQTAAKLYSLSSDSVAANRGVDSTTTAATCDDFDILAAQRGATNDFHKSTIDGDNKTMIYTQKDDSGSTRKDTIDNGSVKNISPISTYNVGQPNPKNTCYDDFDLLVAQRGSWNNADNLAAGTHSVGGGNSSCRASRTSMVQLTETRIRRNRDDFDMLAARAATLNLPDIPAFHDTGTKNNDADDTQAMPKPRWNSDDFDLLAARATTLNLPDIPTCRGEDGTSEAKVRCNTDEFNMIASSRAARNNFLPEETDVEGNDQHTRRILRRSRSSSTDYRSLNLGGDKEDSLRDHVTEDVSERPLWARQYGPRKRVLNTEDPNELTYWVIDPMSGLCYLEIEVEDSTQQRVEEFLAQRVDLEDDGDDRLQLSSKIWSQVNHASSTAMEASSAFARSCVTPKSKKTSNRGRRKIRPSLSFRGGSTKSRLTRSFSFNSVR